MNNRVLVISPHADDATIFVGGTLARLAAEGKSIYIARVTNDDFDSFGLDTVQTIENNRVEAEAAYSALGAHEVIHLGYVSDYMMSADYNALRGDIVRLIRKIRPYSIYSFAMDMKGESNMDHRVITAAVSEALWVSTFQLHYPEQVKEGLGPFSVPETVNFSTAPTGEYSASDISSTIDKKIEALKCHKTPINNMLENARLSAQCAGLDTGFIDGAIAMDRDAVIDMFARKLAAGMAEPFGLDYAEMIHSHPPGMGLFGSEG